MDRLEPLMMEHVKLDLNQKDMNNHNHNQDLEPDTKDVVTAPTTTIAVSASLDQSASVSSITSIAQRSMGFPTYYIARDYTAGLEEAFRSKFPKQLRGYVSKSEWKNTICTINGFLRKGDRISIWTVTETILEAATCHAYGLFVPSRKERTLKKMVAFIEEQNRTVYIPRLIKISNPLLNGLRHLEIVFLDRQAEEPE